MGRRSGGGPARTQQPPACVPIEVVMLRPLHGRYCHGACVPIEVVTPSCTTVLKSTIATASLRTLSPKMSALSLGEAPERVKMARLPRRGVAQTDREQSPPLST